MWTKGRKSARGKLAHEILGILAVTLLISVVLGGMLAPLALLVVDGWLELNGQTLTPQQLSELNGWIFNGSVLMSALFFVVLFLFLLGERLSYLRDILRGIDALKEGNEAYEIPVEGNNELSQLARTINGVAEAQRQIREKEQTLQAEKDQLIRTLSHDIRTPLTAILSYASYLSEKEQVDTEERKSCLDLIARKAEQIRQLTDILLEGGKREPVYFADARVLMEQLAEEFWEALDGFAVEVDLSGCPVFGGTFDVQELRRIFDNLSSNVQKYANPAQPVILRISVEENSLKIRQENAVRQVQTAVESYGIGLNSIRRIAQQYAGQVLLRQQPEYFSITVILNEWQR